MTMISGPYPMAMVRLETARIGLKFEVETGMKFCRISALALCKRELGMRGSKKNVLGQLTAYIDRVKHGEDAVKAADGQWYTGQEKRKPGYRPVFPMHVFKATATPEELQQVLKQGEEAPAKPKTVLRKARA